MQKVIKRGSRRSNLFSKEFPFSKDEKLQKMKREITKKACQPRHTIIQSNEEIMYHKLLKTLPKDHEMTNAQVYELACRLVSNNLKVDDREFNQKVDSYLRKRNLQLAQREALKKELEEEERLSSKNRKNGERNSQNLQSKKDHLKIDPNRMPSVLKQVRILLRLILIGCGDFQKK